jgi:hypothetical protein
MARQRGKGVKNLLPTGRDDMDAVQQTPQLDRQAQARIGEQLRSMYDDLLKQPVPDRFVELLRKLDAKEDGGTGA